MKVSLLTGGNDPPYVLPLLSALTSRGITVDFIGNDEMQNAEAVRNKNVNYLNLRGDQRLNAPMKEKIFRVIRYYFKLIKYAALTDSKLFHIIWLNKFIHFDRTFLNLYYKISGKKLVFTAHNINAEERDEKDSLINRLTLKFMYKNVDHIFVHTNKMRLQLIEGFNVSKNKVTVIPFGINNTTPKSELTSVQAKEKLHLRSSQKIILFFGQIAAYKGLGYLISALVKLKTKGNDYRLIIAGKIKKGYQAYWENIDRIIEEHDLESSIMRKIEFIPDEEIEIYFKASDVLILPYKNIFQSGVLFLAYNFGLPVIATDVGSLRENIVEGKTGFICKPEDPDDLAEKIDLYFNSDLYRNLEANRNELIKYANDKYSWEKIGEQTYAVYKSLL
jgi:glycosyltransferase involved in cell wall biosynthesis